MNQGQNKPLILGNDRTISLEIPDADSNETVMLQDSNETVMLQDSNETVMLQDSNETVMLQDSNETVMLQDPDETAYFQDLDGTMQLSVNGKDKGHSRELYQMAEGEILADRYVIGDILGFGGFGITYSAWDNKLDMRVAIKEYYPSNLVNRVPGTNRVEIFSEKKRAEYEKGLNRFLGEAQNMAKFAGIKNIVSVYNYFCENGTAYLVMEYLDGVSLKEYTKEHGEKLPYSEVIEITKSLLSALKILHKNHIIHRDISPDNIFMCKDGTVKLIDFGAARFASETEEEKTLSVILKPGYAPPEQYRSKGKQGPWTDIYALGATMYRTVTGVVPEESVNRLVQDTLQEPRTYVSDIPKYFNNILMKSLALQAQLRFQNVNDLERKLLRKKNVSSVKGDLFRRKFMRAVMVLLIIAGVGYFGFREYEYVQSERNKATLEECTVTVWVPLEDGEDAEVKKETFAEAIADFKSTYPFVDVQIDTVSESEYSEKLEEAAKNNILPTVFETEFLPVRYDSCLADLSDTYNMLGTADYIFAGIMQQGIRGTKQLPTAFDIPIVYENSTLSAKAGEENDLTAFLEEENPRYLSTFRDYEEIQTKLAGIYEISLPDVDELPVDFQHVWSVSNQGTTAQQNAGTRLLYYLMSEQAQDILYVQGDDGFPLHKGLLDVYISINPEMGILSEIQEENCVNKDLTERDLDGMYQSLK